MNLEALFDAVIVKPLENEETQYGSIFVPDMGKDKNEKNDYETWVVSNLHNMIKEYIEK